MNKFVCEIETLFGGRLVVIYKNAAFLFAFDEYRAENGQLIDLPEQIKSEKVQGA